MRALSRRGVLALSLALVGAEALADKFPQGGARHPRAAPARGAQNPPPNAGQPAGAARIEVLVLEATMGAGGIARELSHLPQLRQPPFASYTQITLVSRTTLPLGASASTAPLPNGGSAALTSSGRNPEGRHTVDVRFAQGGQNSTIQFVASPGEPFFTVRSSRPDRALIVGFIVRN